MEGFCSILLRCTNLLTFHVSCRSAVLDKVASMLAAAIVVAALVQPGAADVVYMPPPFVEGHWAQGAEGSLAVGWAGEEVG